METLNNKTLSFPAKIFTQALAVLGMVLTLAACSKDGGNSGITVPVYGSGCQNCTAISSPVLLTTFKSQSYDGNVILQNMAVYAQSTGLTYVASGNTYKGYRGPIASQGQLIVKTPQYDYVPGTAQLATACVVPAGTYTLQAATVGEMDYDGVNVFLPSLITTAGAIELKVEAPSPMGFLDAGQTLWAKVSIVRVNGVLCSANFFGTFK